MHAFLDVSFKVTTMYRAVQRHMILSLNKKIEIIKTNCTYLAAQTNNWHIIFRNKFRIILCQPYSPMYG